eukprot:gene3638-4530_t
MSIVSAQNVTDSDKPFKMAVIISGGPTDLGFNYMINDGAMVTEKLIRDTNIKVFYNTKQSESYDLMRRLCHNEKYDLIIAGSLEFVTPARLLSNSKEECTNTKWLIRGSITPTERSTFVTYNVGICHYLMGYFAGKISKTGNLGFIDPGPPFLNTTNISAFFLGARESNPSATVYYYNSGAWVDPDVSLGASNSLMDKYGVDVISSSQDDMSVQTTVIGRGLFALGTNGFPLRRIYGEDIGASFITNWTAPYYRIAKAVKEKTYNSKQLGNYFGDFEVNSEYPFLTMDFSSHVQANIRQDVEKKISLLVGTNQTQSVYLCNKYNQYILPNVGPDGCISYGAFFRISEPYPGMVNLGLYKVPLVKVPMDESVIYGVTITAGIFLIASLGLMVVVWHYRNTSSIRSASPIFCIAIIAGAIMVYAGIIVWVVPVSTATCNLRFWLVTIGFALFIGSLVVKNFRIWLIFDNPELRTIKITNLQLFPWVAMVIGVVIVLMSIITGVGDLQRVDARNIDGLGKYEFVPVCKMSHKGSATLYVLLGFFACMLLVGVFVSWKIRIVDIEEFNESKPIANTLYAISFILFVIVPLMVTPQSNTNENIILSASGLFIITSALFIIFAPKLYRIALHGASSSSEMFSSKKPSAIASSRAESASKSAHSKENTNSGAPADSLSNYRGPIHAEFTDDSESDEVEMSTINSSGVAVSSQDPSNNI